MMTDENNDYTDVLDNSWLGLANSASFSKFEHQNMYIEIFATKIHVCQMFGDKNYVLEFLLKTAVYLRPAHTLFSWSHTVSGQPCSKTFMSASYYLRQASHLLRPDSHLVPGTSQIFGGIRTGIGKFGAGKKYR